MSIPSYKEIVDLVKTGLTIEAQEKIMELRVAALELQEENLNLRSKVSELETELSLGKTIVFDSAQGIYWKTVPGGREGPFCAVCYDKDKKLVRLQNGLKRAVQTPWVCFICSNSFL